MRKFRILKIVLMLAIFLILCIICTKTKATITISDDKYSFSYKDVLKGMELFCTERKARFYMWDSLKYEKDGEAFSLNGSSEYEPERGWAYLFALNQTGNYDSSTWELLGDNPLQKAIWAGLNDKNFIDIMKKVSQHDSEYNISFWNDSSNSMLKEAYQYAIHYKTNDSLDLHGDNIVIDTTNVACNGNEIGPIYIKNCGYWIYNDEIKAGVSKLSVYYDLNETKQDLPFTMFYYSNGEKTTIENLLTLNQVMSTGFYIELNDIPTIANIKLAIGYKSLDPKATVQPLKSAMKGGYPGGDGHIMYCDEHKGTSITMLGGERYTSSSEVVYLKDWPKDSEKDDTIIKYTHTATNTTTFSYCENCGARWDTIGRNPCNPGKEHSRKDKTSTVYTFTKTTYKKFTCTNMVAVLNEGKWINSIPCGYPDDSPAVSYLDAQKLVYVTSELNEKVVDVEVQIDLIPKIAELSLVKINKDTGNALTGAKFSGTITNIKSFTLDREGTVKINANSNNTYSFTNWEVNSSGKITIYNVELVDKDTDVVITLEETAVPNGYMGINGTITITVKYSNGTVEIDNEHSNLVDVSYENGKVILKAKNERKPQTNIILTKVDNDDTNLLLPNVKFSGTVENIMNSSTYEDVVSFTGITDENGKITLNNYMIKDITKPVKITITETEVATATGYYYKKLAGNLTITLIYNNGNLKLDNYNYDGQENVTVTATDDDTKNVTINVNIPNERAIDLTGYVWLDGDTILNNKTNGEANGIKDNGETGVPNVIVYLYNSSNEVIKTTLTDSNGEYTFENVPYDGNGYYVVFEYDGINYERTADGESNANENGRDAFNSKFHTITNGKATSTDGQTVTELSYNTTASNGVQKSKLATTGERTVNGENYSNVVLEKYAITASSDNIKTITENINLGLVLRGTDLAASNKVNTARVTINGEEATYTYYGQNNAIDVNKKSSTEVSYNLNIRNSDYMYRIRDYVNNQNFTETGYTENTENGGNKSGDELKIYVTYQVDITNQSPEATTVNQLVYNYDSRYTFNKTETDKLNNLAITDSTDKTLTIDVNTLVDAGTTQRIYIVFELPRENIADDNEYYNAVEITSYSNAEGLIDIDSEPGNLNYNKTTHTGNFEDDSDEAGGVKVSIKEDNQRTISGYVFEDSDKNGIISSSEAKVNDVIVQLIELRTINNKQFEYIWEETVSGSGKLKKLSNDGQSIEDVTYEAKEGYYELKGFIPGNYIVRFIYGDGTTYDLNNNITKYNGQDYKSTIDSKYTQEWYNAANYSNGSSVARDNEARRLETMSYAVNVDANKGALLKLLDVHTVSGLNEVEKATITSLYNAYYDPDITTITDEAVIKLLKEQTLKNTWMCAETSKIDVDIDANTNFDNVYFGLAKRNEANIELNKYITGFKLTASNGQVLVNAKVDVEKYFEEGGNVADYIEGIKDSIQAINEYWKYEVDPTTINTVVEGATLEFEYTVVVSNIGEKDYLSNTLITAYNNGGYDQYLKNTATAVKASIKNATHTTGTYLGSYYYNGTIGSNNETLVEVTDIRDYIRNDLKYVSGTNDVAVYNEPAGTTHYILNTDYSLGTIKLNTVLHNGKTSGKLTSGNKQVMYAVKLQSATALSTAANMDFYNYIAEVMNYTNAAGRRAASSTPGNAEIIDHEYRDGKTHEIDEAATSDIQIGAATGEDTKTNYVWLITIASSITVIALGAYATKKFIIKK